MTCGGASRLTRALNRHDSCVASLAGKQPRMMNSKSRSSSPASAVSMVNFPSYRVVPAAGSKRRKLCSRRRVSGPAGWRVVCRSHNQATGATTLHGELLKVSICASSTSSDACSTIRSSSPLLLGRAALMRS
eukprot:scaffold65067_cov67-Phaeocystis_antarctica.AAC.4